MNPNNQFSGENPTPDQPTNSTETFGATPEESNRIQDIENNTPATETQPTETPTPTPVTDTSAPPAAVVATPTDTAAKKSKKKAIVIIASILLVVGVAVATVVAWDLLTPPTEAPTTTETTPTEQPEETPVAPVENAEQLDAEIDAIESELNSVDDTEFSDETISDDTLQQ